ncbi:MAG: DUF2961 domain-containing protein, partial [Arenicellales bacterium WSBS_2016_MAG_OTU3]
MVIIGNFPLYQNVNRTAVIDDDNEFPTICGTGTEDYFLGSHNYDIGVAVKGHPSAYTK